METRQTSPNSTDNGSTFRARGAAVPFTTPMLAGTRLRTSDRDGVELVIPNPSGGRGAYILQPASIRSFCLPTVHDTLLLQRLSKLNTLTPPLVRHIALRLAAEGHAGGGAIAAAEQALAADTAQQTRTMKQMMAGLIEEVTPGQACSPGAADLARRTDQALRGLGPHLRSAPERLAAGLQILARSFAPVGFPHHSHEARLPRLLGRMHETASALSAWIEMEPANDLAGLGSAIVPAIQMAWETGATLLTLARSCLGNPFQLLRRWVADASAALEMALRCEWLLDGWDQACLLWLTAENDAARRAALLALPAIVPVLPAECLAWRDIRIPQAATEPPCRVISRQDGWRSGATAHGLIERNERLRARSL